MDISNITDLQLLKSMVYDEIIKRDMAARNLEIISDRINELQAGSSALVDSPEKPLKDKGATKK